MTAPRHPALDGARGFVTLVGATELLADPDLLAAYGAAFGADDDATLAIAATGDAAEIEALGALAERAGLSSAASPDMLIVPGVDLAELEPHVDALLGDAPAAPARFDRASVARLARLYEQRRGVPAPDQQAARIARYRALWTCATIVGEPRVVQPVLCVGAGRIEFGDGVVLGWPMGPGFHSGYSYLDARAPESVIRIGARCEFNNGVSLVSEGPGIDIGEDALFGHGVQVFDSDFHELHPARRRGGRPRMAAVRLGRNVFAGAGALVLPGAMIGDDSVIGAGSVVVGEIPAGVVAAGSPARVVRSLEDVT